MKKKPKVTLIQNVDAGQVMAKIMYHKSGFLSRVFDVHVCEMPYFTFKEFVEMEDSFDKTAKLRKSITRDYTYEGNANILAVSNLNLSHSFAGTQKGISYLRNYLNEIGPRPNLNIRICTDAEEWIGDGRVRYKLHPCTQWVYDDLQLIFNITKPISDMLQQDKTLRVYLYAGNKFIDNISKDCIFMYDQILVHKQI